MKGTIYTRNIDYLKYHNFSINHLKLERKKLKRMPRHFDTQMQIWDLSAVIAHKQLLYWGKFQYQARATKNWSWGRSKRN